MKSELAGMEGRQTIEDVFGGSNGQEVEGLENELREIIDFEKQNMGYRKYWWIWLEVFILLRQQKILSLDYQDLAARHEDFERLECLQEDIRYGVQVDLDYPRR